LLAEKREKRRENSGGRDTRTRFLRHKAQVGADTIRPKEERKKKKEEWWEEQQRSKTAE